MTDTTNESFERKVARFMAEFYIINPERTAKMCKEMDETGKFFELVEEEALILSSDIG